MSYDTESKSRNADFISIAAERQSATLGAKGPVKLKNPWAEGPSILRTFPSELSETCGLGPLWYCVPPSPRKRWDNKSEGRTLLNPLNPGRRAAPY